MTHTTAGERRLRWLPGVRFAVVVPFFAEDLRQVDLLDQQLSALVKQEGAPPYAVVVSANGCSPPVMRALADAVDRHGVSMCSSASRLLPGGARNQGAAAAPGADLLFVDADDVVSPTYVAAMCESLAVHDLVACRVDLDELNTGWRRDVRSVAQEAGLAGGFLPWGYGGTLGMKRHVFEHVGGFDVALRTAEDEDICWRLQLAGFRISYCSEAVVSYRVPTNAKGFWRQGLTYGAGQQFVDRRFGLAGPSLASETRLVAGAIALVVRGPGTADRARGVFLLGRRCGSWQGRWLSRHIDLGHLGQCPLIEPDVIPVYLVHWNAPEWCAASLRSILASEGVALTVTVINNSPELATELGELTPPRVSVLETGSNLGYTGAANLALRHASVAYPDEPLVAIVNHDLHVDESAFAKCVAALRSHPTMGIVGPYVDGSSNIEIAVHNLIRTGRNREGVLDVEWVSGQFLLMRSACVRSVGSLDERFGSYAEDVDYGRRVRAAGWRVGVVAESRAFGVGSASPHAWELTRTNLLLLDFKERGYLGLAVGLCHLVVQAARCAAGAVAPWRPATARSASRRRLRQVCAVAAQTPSRLRGFRGLASSHSGAA